VAVEHGREHGRVQRGLSSAQRHTVMAEDSAAALGSGDLLVLGTPRLLAWCEAATIAALAHQLGQDQSTVGTRIQLEHARATPVGAVVTVRAELVHVDGRLLRFEVVAEDETGATVGYGQVTRVIVDRARFMDRLQRP